MAPNGHAARHALHPKQSSASMATDLPSQRIAPAGHALTQGASSHWRHWIGAVTPDSRITERRGLNGCPCSIACAMSELIWASTQAISQARQPMHREGTAKTKVFIPNLPRRRYSNGYATVHASDAPREHPETFHKVRRQTHFYVKHAQEAPCHDGAARHGV